MYTSRIIGKDPSSKKIIGSTPAVILWNPKYPRNVGSVLRTASCYDFEQVIYTGDRINDTLNETKRLPREERMRGYDRVSLINTDYPFDLFEKSVVPIAVEISDKAELLPQFEHPENAVYVFGPEDGSIPSVALRHCHRHVVIPTSHCLNLSIAVSTVLYDRCLKRQMAGLEEIKPAYQILKEQRKPLVCDFEDEA